MEVTIFILDTLFLVPKAYGPGKIKKSKLSLMFQWHRRTHRDQTIKNATPDLKQQMFRKNWIMNNKCWASGSYQIGLAEVAKHPMAALY